ncbi:MAG: (d)CMP kinase [Clostridiales bacterium]|nr:(d)CMP kinase [Clostridiales bacterium]
MIKIAVDGLTGSGKGTLSDGIAERFNLRHLDTGAIFRGMGVSYLKSGITEPTEENVKEILEKTNISVVFENDKQQIYLNGENVTSSLREEAVSKLASKVSALGLAREKYLEIIRDFTNKYDCIIDGRDITSIVMPDADVKIYLTANETTRAERRYKENVEKNIACTFEEVLANIQERDYRDTHRDIAPLIIVPDAFVVDNTNINLNETIELCSNHIEKVLKENGKL